MKIAEVDPGKVYAYREGRIGMFRPVRILDTENVYVPAGGGTYKVPESRSRIAYHGRRERVGRYLAVTVPSYHGSDAADLAAIRSLTLADAMAGKLPEGLSLKLELLTDTRWVRDEEWEACQARLAREQEVREAARADRLIAQTRAQAAMEQLSAALCGAEIEATIVSGVAVTVTLSTEAAGQLTEILEKVNHADQDCA